MNSPARILIVDDDPNVRGAVARVLRAGEYELAEAADGAAALRMAREQRSDLVLLDVALPDLDGVEVCRRIKDNPVSAGVLVVHLSAKRTAVADKVQALAGGADGYLTWPIDPAELLAHVQAFLRIKRAEDALLAQEQQFRATFEQAAVGMVHVAPDGRWLRINQRFCEIAGYTMEEIWQRDFRELTYPGDLDSNLDYGRQLLAGEIGAYATDKRYVRSDGTLIWVRLTLSLVRHPNGTPDYFIAVVEDISSEKTVQLRLESAYQELNSSRRAALNLMEDAIAAREAAERALTELQRENAERKQAEEENARLQGQLFQAQKMESVGRLAGGIAHDFNNLLMAILGYSEMTLRGMAATDPVRQHLHEIKAAGERAADLTRQLLAFSRKQILQPRVLDLNEVVANLSNMLRRLIGEDIHLVTVFEPALGRVQVDPGQIEQVITNLAVNARDAMPRGGTLTIAMSNAELDEAYANQAPEPTRVPHVALTISDTGTGMTPEVKAHLFEPFFTTKGLGKGTGLGLATVFGIVKQSGGHIVVDSEPRRGTAFTVYLPRIEDPGRIDVSPEVPAELPRGTETILVVEDEDKVRQLVCAILEHCGYTVLAADKPGDALELTRKCDGRIHLLLSDVIMPGMNGPELAQQLSALNPGIKVLYMSGYTADVIAHHGVLDEGVRFIQKPFSVDDLTRKVREALGNT